MKGYLEVVGSDAQLDVLLTKVLQLGRQYRLISQRRDDAVQAVKHTSYVGLKQDVRIFPIVFILNC